MMIPEWVVWIFPVVVAPSVVGLFNLRTRVSVIEAQIANNQDMKNLIEHMDRRLVALETILAEMRRRG
ncbi:hypothetical protein GCM10023116_43530 [Kistimonas scapharcae]|uniref:Phage shock protein B n=1 Tax=Kistimonas scapharcae TaxID=1036133 RepID=A0ABP8V964_9GAMM